VLFAQQGGQPAEGYAGQQGAQQADVDAATVDKVANALVEVTSIQQDFTQQLEGVKGDEQARELQTEAQEKMVAAVQQAGLSVGEYNHVVELMNQNPVLRQQVMERAESIQ
jgi:hypothetical protein